MCLFPTTASIPEDGGRPTPNPEGNLKLPCGKCTECISKRSMEWALRAKHEISLHKENCFLTLTYNPESLPSDFICKTEFQNFMKRLRKKIKRKLNYMVSHEYGTNNLRPHHHVLLFGYSPINQKLLKYTKSGYPLFTSPEIESLWDLGYHSIGEANEKTAYYIASYSLKGKKHDLQHPTTGEIITVCDSMDVSKRPGIGLNYLKKNAEQLINSGEILPRYYLKKLESLAPHLLQQYQDEQLFNIKTRSSHEILAKHTINEQKKSLLSGEFRSAPENCRQAWIESKNLKIERNLYASTKEKK